MDTLTVLITGGGAPGIMGTIYSLKQNWDGRKIKTVCVDMKDDVVGKYLCDSFHRIPGGKDKRFIPTLLDICEKEHVDVILPQVTSELLPLSTHKKEFYKEGFSVAISPENTILIANNKAALMERAKRLNVPVPEFKEVTTWDALIDFADKIGYPFAVKPPEGSGMRGFRLVHKNLDKKSAFYNEKPSSSDITVEELHAILGDDFPPLLVMENLPGEEYTVDLLSDHENVHAVIPRKRLLIRTGITFVGAVENNEDIIEYSERLTKDVGLTHAHGYQFKLDMNGTSKLLESNPRIQGTMVLSTVAGANIIYGAVKVALDEEIPEFNIRWETKLYRYWGGVGVNTEGVKRI